MSSPQLKKILYAEDEPDIRQIATIAFEAIGGFQVETCESGETVVETAHAFKPDLFVLDVMMPSVASEALLARFEEFLRPAVIQTLGDAFMASQGGDALLAAQARYHDPDLLLSRILLARLAANIPNSPLRRVALAH